MKQLQTLKSDLHQSRIAVEQLGEDIQDTIKEFNEACLKLGAMKL